MEKERPATRAGSAAAGEREPDAGIGIRRKRVSHACHLCRSMKSKCDGKWPECSRCRGYGYQCVYGNGKRHHHHKVAVAVSAAAQGDGVRGQSDLREAIRQYEILLETSLSQLPTAKQQDDANGILARMKAADRALSDLPAPATAPTSSASATRRPTNTAPDTVPYAAPDAASDLASPRRQAQLQTERFLGEVSDVRFFNLVKQVIQSHLGSVDAKQGIDSYEQDGDILSPNVVSSRVAHLPSAERLATFADAYFSTIHLAFPFINKAPFMRSVGEARDSTSNATPDSTTLALIFVVCAIGAYYASLPGKAGRADTSHEAYYLQALSLTFPAGTDRSIDHVCLLLAQCFYLLVVCRTDSCWITLGQTVRLAQSIGLHVEQDVAKANATAQSEVAIERRRRVWSCIYCLDRLLSLQLGRPPAIHEDYCNVPRPSRLGDSDIDWDSEHLPANFKGPSAGDYHIALISFSDIISQVLRDLCSGRPNQNLAAELVKTKMLDQQLLQWKFSLPRTLRFDLGHTFDQTFVFKRQRSMFAIKYHHLRSLIHRPYLCYPVLRNLDETPDMAFAQINWPLVGAYEKICIAEARETARLLHPISSEKELVEEFPWWQMISCLIFAGSILLVSSIFTQNPDSDDNALENQEAASAYDDAETCLRAFESLGINSAGAGIARDMMERLKEYGQKWRDAVKKAAGSQSQGPAISDHNLQPGASTGLDALLACDVAPAAASADAHAAAQGHPLDMPAPCVPTPSAWPPEMVDSMAWSIQFLETFPPRGQL